MKNHENTVKITLKYDGGKEGSSRVRLVFPYDSRRF